MSMNARKIQMEGGKRFEQEPLVAGVYPVRVVQVVLLGIQPQRAYQGQEKDPVLTLRVTHEFLDEFCVDEDGNIQEDRPRWLSETFPLYSLDSERANSTKRYFAIDPEEKMGGDWAKLVGMPVMATITARPGTGKHEGKVFNNIAGLSTMREKEQKNAPALVNDALVFDPYDPDMEAFATLPEWLQDVIKGAEDYEGSDLEGLVKKLPASDDGENNPKERKGGGGKAADKEKEGDSPADEEDEDW